MLSTAEAYGSSWGEYEASREKRGLPPAAKFLSAYVLDGKYRAQREDRGGAEIARCRPLLESHKCSRRDTYKERVCVCSMHVSLRVPLIVTCAYVGFTVCMLWYAYVSLCA